MEIITLSNGKRVANFSSPHAFEFEDGTILPEVCTADSQRLKVTFIEEDLGNGGDVKLSFELSDQVKSEMRFWRGLWLDKQVDVVFCPLCMITAMYEERMNVELSPFRSIRVVDRISKKISISKQCI